MLLLSEKQTNKELVQEFQLEKEDLENEYTRFAQQYDELKLTVSNDSLSVLLEQEQLKTQRLLEELRTVKSSNAAEIRRLKKELATLRKVMIGYINQIDSLNRLTAHQKEVIAQVTQKYNDASRQISNLAEEKKNLNKKVTLAAQLDATNINIQAVNKRDKTAKKVKDVVKFKIGFTIVNKKRVATESMQPLGFYYSTESSSILKFNSLPAISWFASKVMVSLSLSTTLTGNCCPYGVVRYT